MRQINVRRVFKILASVFPTRSDTNKAERPQKMVRGLKFRVKEEESCTIYLSKRLISCTVTVQLICAFVFA